MNYDVIDFCIKELMEHRLTIRTNDFDAIFYHYEEVGRKTKGVKFDTVNLNTEFFTFNRDVAEKIANIRTFKQFSNHKALFYEHIISFLSTSLDPTSGSLFLHNPRLFFYVFAFVVGPYGIGSP